LDAQDKQIRNTKARSTQTANSELIRVEWKPSWEPISRTDTSELTANFLQCIDGYEHARDKGDDSLPPADYELHDLERQGFEQNPNPTITWHSIQGIEARTTKIDMQPTNPQVDINPTGQHELWIREVELLHYPQSLNAKAKYPWSV